METPVGLCQCGCGQPTKKATRSDRARGIERGDSLRFVGRHNSRTKHPGYQVDSTTGCWNWLGFIDRRGYAGKMYWAGHFDRAYRIFYLRFKGPIPVGLELDHLCRNTRCVNPDHLEAVTTKENRRRSSRTHLTPYKVRAIRSEIARGASQRSLASRFSVSKRTIESVAARENWGDV